MKAKILSTVDIKQEWLDEIKGHIPGIEFDVERTTKPLQVYRNSRTDTMYAVWSHLRSLFPSGDWRYRVYVMSDAERLAYGMTDHLAAYNNLDRDGVLDFYMAATEKNLARARLNGFKYNFARIFVHEALHGKEQEHGREYLAAVNPDRTHDWEKEGRLPELIKEHFLRREVSRLQAILQSLLNRFRPALQHPVAGFPISQPYGVPNSRYPLTRHHVGTDYATPIGTPVLMPADGTMVRSGYSSALGSFVIVQYVHRGQRYQSRFAHLDRISQYLPGETIRKGSVIGRTGNSGDSTGPHLHWDVWVGEVNLTGITASNFRQRTVDPELHLNS